MAEAEAAPAASALPAAAADAVYLSPYSAAYTAASSVLQLRLAVHVVRGALGEGGNDGEALQLKVCGTLAAPGGERKGIQPPIAGALLQMMLRDASALMQFG